MSINKNTNTTQATTQSMNTNIGKPIIRMKKYLSQIYFRILTNNKSKDISSLLIAHVFLKAIQLHDPSAKLLTCPAENKPRLNFTSINTILTGDVPQSRTYQQVHKTDKKHVNPQTKEHERLTEPTRQNNHNHQ
jgi:hypothetical protein